jgi:hypothetical protein
VSGDFRVLARKGHAHVDKARDIRAAVEDWAKA